MDYSNNSYCKGAIKMTGKDIVNEIGKKGLKKLPKPSIPKTVQERAALILKTHIKNRTEDGPVLLTKVETEGSYHYGVMSSVDSTWHSIDINLDNCQCNTKKNKTELFGGHCHHELALSLALEQKVQIPTLEDLLEDEHGKE